MGAERWRLFVALDIPDEVRDLIRDSTAEIRDNLSLARWVSPENLHLTLKFIGEFDARDIRRLEREMLSVARKADPFVASLGGCGAFPGAGKARVLWVGMDKGEVEAAALARKLDAGLGRVGVKREERPFRGHLTLARMRRPVDCTALLERLEDRMRGLKDLDFRVCEFTLYRSILGPQGPRYQPLLKAVLGAGVDEVSRREG